MPTIELTDEQYAIVCGAVAGEAVNIDGIFGDWKGLREKLPLHGFTEFFGNRRDPAAGPYYDEEAGL